MRITNKFDLGTLEKIKALYELSFPKSEKKPFALIEEKCREGKMEINAILGCAGEFLGLAIFVLSGDIALLDYFAISPEARGTGVGSSALKMLKNLHTGRRFMLEIEDDENAGAENLADRIRRRKFYLRSGMVEMPYKVWLFGVDMKILTFGDFISFEEYHDIFVNVFSEKTARNVTLMA